ncbi:tropomyosin-like [Sycon ciliatum]|uniref:tropomyosin-like n=1 Tax=Sycon ciliatum TaxID=27933 RepID=UPI0020ADC67A|eukprot:scpid92773/ scgid11156/ 
MASAVTVRQKLVEIKAERDRANERADKAESRLKNLEASLEESEQILEEYNKKIAILEGDIDEAEERVKTTEEQHRKADAEADELEHKARRTLTLSGTDTAKASAMTAKWKVANKRAEESEALFEELENKVRVLTEDLDTCEEREQEYKEATQANEQKLLTLTADTRSLQVQTNKSSDYEQRLQRKVDDLERKIDGAAERAKRYLEDQRMLEQELEDGEDQKDQLKVAYEEVKAEHDAMMAELGDI